MLERPFRVNRRALQEVRQDGLRAASLTGPYKFPVRAYDRSSF
jgi:hypothetical protein